MTEHHQRYAALIQLTLTRLREFVREPEALFWVLVFPILMALALGLAFRSGGETAVLVGVEERSGSEALLAVLDRAPGIDARLVPAAAAAAALRNGEIHILVVGGSPPTYRYDPTRTESRLARLALDDALQRAAGRVDALTPTEDRVVVRGSRYIDWLVPGLLGMNIMSTGVWSIGFSVVYARSRKLLKQLGATPMRRRDYLLAQTLARVLFLGVEVVALLLFGWLVFDVPVRGSLLLLTGLCVVGSLSFAGLGLLVASRARTIEAVSGLVNVVLLPMWVLSGVFFASANFPAGMQPFIQALPLTALNDALRAVMIEGATLAAIAGEIGILGIWGVASFGLALKLFKWH